MSDYRHIATKVRLKVLEMIHRAQTSHLGSNFSVIDLAVVLYENLDPDDMVCWSKGWSAATTYIMLARQGKIPWEDLDKFPNPPYIGLVEANIPGVNNPGGSMGYGLPFGVGYALAKKLKGEPGTVYVIMSDGEMAVGTTWEAAALAAHHKLNNLVVIVDCNGWQAMGKTKDVLNMERLEDKWESFGWRAHRLHGHNYFLIEHEIKPCIELKNDRPLVIIADTIKGKGVSFFENKLEWHYKNISDEDYKRAMKELNGVGASG